MHVGRERRSTAVFIVEGEHAHAPRLTVAAEGQERRLRSPRGVAEGAEDVLQLLHRPVPEKRERDVQVVARARPDLRHAFEGHALPRGKAAGRLVREA